MTQAPKLSYRPSAADLDRVMRVFGVAESQVRRDFVISWMLWSISRSAPDVVFLGGTALSRTLLPDLRLSEDIDLMPLAPRAGVATAIDRGLIEDLERGFGQVSSDLPLPRTRHAQSAVYSVGGYRVRLQLVDRHSYSWPWAPRDIGQRYEGCPPAVLNTLTPDGFVAAKTAAWCERKAPRDLYDLWALAREGHVTGAAAETFRRLGPTNTTPAPALFPERPPTEQEWKDALGHQCIPHVGPVEAYRTVVDAWDIATSEDEQ